MALRCIPIRVVRGNGASNATVSADLIRLVHCHQHLPYTCPSGGPRAFNVTFSLVFHYLSYRSLFRHSFITHSFDLPKPADHVLLQSCCYILTSYLVILCTSSLRIRSAKLTPHTLRRYHSSSVICTFRCRITASVATLHCVRPNAQLC